MALQNHPVNQKYPDGQFKKIGSSRETRDARPRCAAELRHRHRTRQLREGREPTRPFDLRGEHSAQEARGADGDRDLSQGRADLTLTDAGETMLAYARRSIELNDEAVAAVRGVEMEGWVRLGLQEDFGETVLPRVLGQFARAHPKVRIEARIARNAELIERVITGQLDLALAWSDGMLLPRSEPIAQVPLCWIGPAAMNNTAHFPRGEPVPLAVLEAPCLLRTVATNALDGAGIPWRIAFTSPSLSGLWAATAAGLGVMVRTPIGVPENLRTLGRGEAGLPELPSLGLVLHRADAEPDPAAARLASILVQAVGEVLPDSLCEGCPPHAKAG
jgi:DNA-binding transcriptional LysR family regulator